MRKMIAYVVHRSPWLEEISYTIIRVTLGIIFLISGYHKLMSGTEHLTQLGSAMTAFGFTHAHLMWGFLAAFTEFFGGISYILGFFTRITSLPLIWLLIVAINFHIQKGDTLSVWGFALLCLSICVSIFISGSGKYSIDYKMH